MPLNKGNRFCVVGLGLSFQGCRRKISAQHGSLYKTRKMIEGTVYEDCSTDIIREGEYGYFRQPGRKNDSRRSKCVSLQFIAQTVDFIRYIFTGRSLQEDYEVLFNLLNINRPRILDRMPVKDIKALRHVLGFIRMIDNSPPELRSQYGLQGRFCDGRIAGRLSYDGTMIREVLLTEEVFGLFEQHLYGQQAGSDDL